MARNTPEQAVRRRVWSQAARPSSRAAADARACPGQTPGSRPPQNPAGGQHSGEGPAGVRVVPPEKGQQGPPA